jgi:hypothetical protein
MKVPQLPPPSDSEIAQWADGVVYAKTPDGVDVYFDARARLWIRVRQLGPGANAQWPPVKG